MRTSQSASSMTKISPFVNSAETRENMHPGIDTANTTALAARKSRQ